MGYYYAIDSYVEFSCTLSDRCLKARFKRFSRELEANSRYWDPYLDPEYYRFYKVDGFTACMDLEEPYAKHRNADEQLAEFISQVIDPDDRCYFECAGEDGEKWGYAIESGKVYYLSYKGPYVETEDGLVPLHLWLSGDVQTTGSKRYLVRVWGDVEPEVVHGPFEADDQILPKVLIEYFTKNCMYDRDDGLYLLEVDHEGKPSLESFSAGFMDEIVREAEKILTENGAVVRMTREAHGNIDRNMHL